MGITLDPPALKISASYFYDPTLYGSAQNLTSKGGQNMLWAWSNSTYNYDYISKLGICQPNSAVHHPSPAPYPYTNSSQDYQWGFSFVQLFVLDILLLLWALSMLVMWYHAQAKLVKQGRFDIGGKARAVIDLADDMHSELDTPNSSLRQRTDKQCTAGKKGGSIASDPSRGMETVPDNSFREWLAHEGWWWLIAAVVCSMGAVFMFVFVWFLAFLLIGPTCGLWFALAVGSTTKSRLVFVFLGLLLGTAVGLILTFAI